MFAFLHGKTHISTNTPKIAEILSRGVEDVLVKESLQKNKVEVGTIAVDAIFTPIRRVAYEVENMRVGDKTNHNRLKIFIQTLRPVLVGTSL